MQQNIEVTEKTVEWFKTNFESARQGMTQVVSEFHSGMEDHPVVKMFQDMGSAHEFMLATWKQMWRHSLSGMKGVFSAGELSLIVDIYNGTMLSPWHYGANSLAVGISDSIALDGMAEKWDVVPEKILEKVENLSPAQALCLEIWANGFWYGIQPDEDRDFEKYVAQLS